jgi:23S rRNA (adenine2503-C2)-methyltransferase
MPSLPLGGLTLAAARAHGTANGLSPFGAELIPRAWRQVMREHCPDLASLSEIAPRKRSALAQAFSHTLPEIASTHASWDKSVRYALRLTDGAVVEAVLIPHHGLWSACVSSQAGCGLACQFCATGRMGLQRNLAAHEIVGQVLAIQRHARVRISDLVFMGMGEPLQNEREVLSACDVFAENEGLQIGKRRMVISTAGIVPAIDRFAAAGHKMKLVFSLGSAVPEKRARLMPIQELWSFERLLESIRNYAASLRGKHVTLEYIAIRNLTLGDDDIEAIREHLHGFKFILNIIPLNPVDPSLEAPTREEVLAWSQKLRPLGFPVKIRRSSGRDQFAACGQLGRTLLSEDTLAQAPRMGRSV